MMEKIGFQQDISNMMLSMEIGALSTSDLEALSIAEGKRAAYSTKVAEMILVETENVFALYEKMSECFLKKVSINIDDHKLHCTYVLYKTLLYHNRCLHIFFSQVVIPFDISQAVFTLIAKILQRIKILKKVVSSSSMTIGSTVMSAETELQNAEQGSPDMNIASFVEQLKELEAKSDVIIDDEDEDKPLFFKKKTHRSFLRRDRSEGLLDMMPFSLGLHWPIWGRPSADMRA